MNISSKVNSLHNLVMSNLYERSRSSSTATVITMDANEHSQNSVIAIHSKAETKPPQDEDPEKPELKILCFKLTKFPPWIQFLICCGGVFFFYLIYGYFQEMIFQLDAVKPYGWYLTLYQFVCYTVFGFFELQFKVDKKRRVPMRSYSLIALLTVATMGLSNSSLGYLNYPTQVIFKCCKLIPVLIGGIIIQGKKFTAIDVIACMCMSVGLIFFTLADSNVSPSFNMYGVTLISMALCADAVIGNVQEKVMRQHNANNSEMVLYSYALGSVYILLGQIASGQLWPALSVCWQNPMRTYGYGFVFSLSGYLGVNIVLMLLRSFGALIAVTVTTCRKALTIIMSFVFFAKPFTIQYVWSGLIVMLGIYLNVYSKNRTRIDALLVHYWQTVILRQRKDLLPTPII